MKNRVRLTESDLHRIVKESVNRVLREAYGEDFEDTLRWVRKKKPNMPPQEQERFARNIVNKYNREHSFETDDSSDEEYDDTIASIQLQDGSVLSVIDGELIDRGYIKMYSFILQLNGEPIAEIINYSPPQIRAIGNGNERLLKQLFEYIKSIVNANCGCDWSKLDPNSDRSVKATFEDCFEGYY